MEIAAEPLMTHERLRALDDDALAAAILAGGVRVAARLMRWIDDRVPRAEAVLRRLHPHAGRAHIIGLTGNPGAGKSTLGAALVAHWRAQGKKVGVIAVDPSSPFSGGALLGDRIRMAEHTLDDSVFIRSVATRGNLGGLSRSTHDLAMVLDAMGYDPILIETVGVGQDEVDVVKVAHTTAVVLVPGLGDEIQAIKAGLLEIADVFVVNKADRDGVERAEKDLRMMQSLGAMHDASAWEPPVVRTVATTRVGVAQLAEALESHRQWEGGSGAESRRLARARHLLESLVHDRVGVALEAALGRAGGETYLARLAQRELDPWAEATRLFEALRG
jgi:LAO/AO transport system kinase